MPVANAAARKLLVNLSHETIEACGHSARAALKHGKSGVERIFHEHFEHQATLAGWGIVKILRQNLPKPYPHRPIGKIDCCLSKADHSIGIEFKVCELPRIGGGRLYDVGQLSGDLAGLNRNFDTEYCIAFVVGESLNCRDATPRKIIREFHNALHSDFLVSMTSGELYVQKDLPRRVDQIKIIKKMGLHKPYAALGNNFIALNQDHRIAAIGFTFR